MLPLALAAVLLAGAPHHRLIQQPNLASSAGAGSTGAGDTSDVFAFAPASGTGLPSIQTLCEAAAGLITGTNSFCWSAATATSTGLQFTRAGTADASATRAVCPNGPSCATVTERQFSASSTRYASAAVAPPQGDFSVCQVLARDNLATNIDPLGQDANASRGFLIDGTSGLSAYVFNTAGSSTSIVLPSAVTKARHLFCVTYDAVADTTSILRSYMDGTAGTPSTAARLLDTITARKWFIGGYEPNANGGVFGFVGDSFYTDRLLTAAEIALLARAVQADTPTGTRGEVMTFTRASAMSCPGDTDAEVSTVPSDRPCVTRDGIYSEPAASNLLQRSEELSTSPWGQSANFGVAAVITVNSPDVAAPDGTYTAEKLVMDAVTGAGKYNRLYNGAYTLTVAAYSYSLWLRTLSGTAEVNIGLEDGSGVVAAFTRCQVTSTWSRCKVENATTTAASWYANIGTNRIGGSETDTLAATVYAWGGQLELGTFASSYIATAGSTATRAATLNSFAKPAAFSDSAGCIAVKTVVAGAPAGVANVWVEGFTGNTQTIYFTSNTPTAPQAHDGTNTSTATVASVVGREASFVWTYSGIIHRLSVDGTAGTQATFDGAISAATFNLGSFGSSAHLSGIIKDVRMSTRTTGCEP